MIALIRVISLIVLLVAVGAMVTGFFINEIHDKPKLTKAEKKLQKKNAEINRQIYELDDQIFMINKTLENSHFSYDIETRYKNILNTLIQTKNKLSEEILINAVTDAVNTAQSIELTLNVSDDKLSRELDELKALQQLRGGK